jgi:hypothetical protein
MSFFPRLSPQESEELFRLFTAAIYQVGSTPKEARNFQMQLRQRLQEIWDTTDPKPFPATFNDFRRSVVEEFLDRLRKEDPRFRRPRL